MRITFWSLLMGLIELSKEWNFFCFLGYDAAPSMKSYIFKGPTFMLWKSYLHEKPCKRSIYYDKPLCWNGTRKGPFLHAKSNLTRFVSDEDWGPFYTNTICFFAPALVLFIAHYIPLLNDITLFCRNMNKCIAICSFGDRGHYRLYSIDGGFLNRQKNLLLPPFQS